MKHGTFGKKAGTFCKIIFVVETFTSQNDRYYYLSEMNERKREEKKEVNFHPIWAVECVAEEMPVVDLPLVHLQT